MIHQKRLQRSLLHKVSQHQAAGILCVNCNNQQSGTIRQNEQSHKSIQLILLTPHKATKGCLLTVRK